VLSLSAPTPVLLRVAVTVVWPYDLRSGSPMISRHWGPVALAGALVMVVAGGASASAWSGGGPQRSIVSAYPPSAAPYSGSGLSSCLRGRGGVLGPVQARDATLRSLRDAAQRTSFEARIGRELVGVAVEPSIANAELLVEVLSLPGNGYGITRADNVVLLTHSADHAALLSSLTCLPGATAGQAVIGVRRNARASMSTASATPAPPIHTVAGTGVSGDTGNGGPAIQAEIDRPRSIDPLSDGSYLVVEPFQNDVRRVWPDGRITNFAGNGTAGYSGDGGPATSAELNLPHAASLLPSGAVLIADLSNNRIREVAPDGTITTVAGNGVAGYRPADDGGQATQAEINSPRGVAALPDGGFLFPDSGNNRIRRVWPNGTITTVAGNGVQGYSGDGGAATSAELNLPFGVSPLPDGGFLIDDAANQVVRRVWPNGTITTVAGNGVAGYTGDGGPATNAELANPHNVWATADGGFLIADVSNSVIRKVDSSGTISTVVGNGTPGYAGDGGPATVAEVAFPKAVAELPSGALLVADTSNNVVRYVGTAVTPTNLAAPTISGQPAQGQQLSATTGSWSATPPASYTYQWERCDGSGSACVNISSATSTTYTPTGPDVGSTLRVVVTATNPGGQASATSAQTAVVAGPPVDTTPPTISGSVVDGQTLTASPGTWSGTQPITFTYQWQRCDGSGGSCTDITGATSTTYVVSSGDIGATFRVRVAAANSVSTSAYRSSVLGDSPVSYWRFDESSGPLVDVQGFATGSYVNSPARAVPGLLPGDPDTAVSLDGTSQYLDVPANGAWTPSAFSIEVLVKPSALPVNKTIWSTIGPGLTGWWLNTGPSGEVRMFVGDGSSWRFTDPNVVLNPGTRYDIAASYDGSNIRLYLDGSLISTLSGASMNGNVSGSPMRFGAYSTGPGQYWPGVIDDATFYSSVLGANQISAHYQASLSVQASATSAATAPATAAPSTAAASGGGGAGGGGSAGGGGGGGGGGSTSGGGATTGGGGATGISAQTSVSFVPPATPNAATDPSRSAASVQTVKLAVRIHGKGAVHRNPAKSSYTRGAHVVLTAKPAKGWRFAHWSGACRGSRPACHITVGSARTATAFFVAARRH
jgi:hypothetical protein